MGSHINVYIFFGRAGEEKAEKQATSLKVFINLIQNLISFKKYNKMMRFFNYMPQKKNSLWTL